MAEDACKKEHTNITTKLTSEKKMGNKLELSQETN